MERSNSHPEEWLDILGYSSSAVLLRTGVKSPTASLHGGCSHQLAGGTISILSPTASGSTAPSIKRNCEACARSLFGATELAFIKTSVSVWCAHSDATAQHQGTAASHTLSQVLVEVTRPVTSSKLCALKTSPMEGRAERED